MNETNPTLTGLFQEAGTALKVFDMGRRIRPLALDEFSRIEQMQTPYPTPYLHHAWIALMLWNPRNADENAVWFLKLPLDEQGYLIAAVRDDLLNRLLSRFAQSSELPAEADPLKENPYFYKPSIEKMAVFHALAARYTERPASAHYAPVQQYLREATPDADWQQLALQGLADLVIRLDETDNEKRLADHLISLPEPLQTHLLGLLEHASFGNELGEKLQQWLNEELNRAATDPVKLALLLRALSSQSLNNTLRSTIIRLFGDPRSRNAEVLSALASRCENWLMDPQLLKLFLEALAEGEAGQTGFSRLLADLMFLPVHRVLILQTLRQPDLSKALKQATEAMFGSAFRPSLH